MATASSLHRDMLRTLPSDAARHTQWGFADRYDLQMLVQPARAPAFSIAAHLPKEWSTSFL
jgi:hypothetical protein